jgi:ABC-2 type transport system ATP-binding protein/ribosome-dependent ATPase
MNPLIETRAVTKRFGDTTAVDSVDLAVEPGEVVGLLGANGAGKTTVIRMILGLERPTSGTVRIFGEAPNRTTRSRLGYVPQGLGLYDDLTVRENLEFTAKAFGAEVPELDHDLAAVADVTVGSISLGFRRRVAFASAMSHGPELLILDEPTSGVGPLGRAELWDAIGGTADNGTGVLVSTHYMEEAEQCDRLVMMANGRVVAVGTVQELTAEVSAVEITGRDWRRTMQALVGAGVRASMVADSVRAVDTDVQRVRGVLEAAGIDGHATEVVAGFEEAFVALSTR